jgi:hemoglobin
MQRICRALVVILASAPLLGGAAAAQETLYQRLGGYDAVAAVTDDFLGRLIADEEFAPFFAGHARSSQLRIRQDVVDLICQETGGPCFYTGRDMKASHEGLGITKAQWDLSVEHFLATLAKLDVPEAEQKELGALILPLEKDIVDAP